MRILIVEDDDTLRDGLETGLMLAEFTADAVSNVEDARAAMSAIVYDVVVLDVGLPDGSGLDLLDQWRREGCEVPVLLLTARNSIEDRIEGLDCGADDYLGKPFDLSELAARLRAIGRRSKGNISATLRWRDLELDCSAREMRQKGVPISLSRRELALMETFMERPGRVFSRNQLEDRLYGWGEEVESNTVEVHIHKLRTKLGRDVIRTLRGQGYRIDRQ